MTKTTIIITAGNVSVRAELDDNPTARKIFDALPIEGRVNRWGDEIYFDIPVAIEPSPDARENVRVGELAYWPVGAAFCIFFGPTPVSTDESPRAYSPVNVFGRVIDTTEALKTVSDGEAIRVSSG